MVFQKNGDPSRRLLLALRESLALRTLYPELLRLSPPPVWLPPPSRRSRRAGAHKARIYPITVQSPAKEGSPFQRRLLSPRCRSRQPRESAIERSLSTFIPKPHRSRVSPDGGGAGGAEGAGGVGRRSRSSDSLVLTPSPFGARTPRFFCIN